MLPLSPSPQPSGLSAHLSPSPWHHCPVPTSQPLLPHPCPVADPTIPTLSPLRHPCPYITDPAVPSLSHCCPHYPISVSMSLPPLCHPHAHITNPAVPPADAGDEGWCRKHGLCSEALRLAGTVRAELLEVMRRIELPVSPPAFGSDANALNIQRALISGYFLKVGPGCCRELWGCYGGVTATPFSPGASQVARDIDGSGNYVMLTHKHVAHLAPASGYLLRPPPRRLPPWVLYHEFTISQDNCLRVVSEIQPQM